MCTTKAAAAQTEPWHGAFEKQTAPRLPSHAFKLLPGRGVRSPMRPVWPGL